MTRLQDDIIGVYNSLVEFSEQTLSNGLPIKVKYEESFNALSFEQRGKKVIVQSLNYYCENLKFLNTYILPTEYDNLMSSLSGLIGSGIMIRERLMVAPKKYGFDLYETDGFNLKDGPQKVGSVDLVYWNSWFFRKYVELIYKKKL
jgi:hypothetical protein